MATPRRGRPPRLSREEIVEAVSEMLEREPAEPLTMARAAEAVGASPMSLYRHFDGKDDLMLAVTRYVLRDARESVPADAPWPDRVRGWMTTVYGKAVRHPQLFQMAASGESMAWLPDAAHLATILQEAGFTEDRALAEAVLWVGSTTLGQAVVAASVGSDMALPALYAAMAHLTPTEAGQVAGLVPHMASLGAGSFDVIVDFTIAALTARLPEPRRPGRKPPAR